MHSCDPPPRLYWGDLHNHCRVGLMHYARGDLTRSIETAREHLDFFAFTGHSQWHDMPRMYDDTQLKWQAGFDYHAQQWPNTRRLLLEANEPEKFVTFLGYEWHSGRYGDRCIIFPDDEAELCVLPDLADLEDLARQYGALLYPHHIAYNSGLPGRGIDWAHLDPDLSPVIEIISEHGCSETDRNPWSFFAHSLGPRTSANTYQRGLARGLHCGVAGGSDDHSGFPGAYGEGLLGVYAHSLHRRDIWEAIWRRRTLAATGDRTAIDLRVNDGFIGDQLPSSPRRTVRVEVKAWDEIAQVEVLRNNRVIQRAFADEAAPPTERWLLRIEYGWGPWSAFGIQPVADWQARLKLRGARILAWQPCLQSGPFDEKRRHSLTLEDDHTFRWTSYTSRHGAYRENPNNAMVFEIEGDAASKVCLSLQQPVVRHIELPLGSLIENSHIEFTGDFPSEALLIHRVVNEPSYRSRSEFDDQASGEGEDFYYVRVTQRNGHMAWCSPIWVAA